MMNATRSNGGGEAIQVLRVVRLAMSGAIAGAAIAGVLFPSFSHFHGIPADAFGAGAGFVAVLGIKVAHLI